MKKILTFQDASALSFVLAQNSRIEAGVYSIRYPQVAYPGLIYIDTTGPEWLDSTIYFSQDFMGPGADWFEAKSDDINKVELSRNLGVATVQMAGIGYGWNIEEVARAQMLGINLTDEKARAARFFAERFVDRVAMYGDATKGMTGLVNNPQVEVLAATGSWLATGTTVAQILADVNRLLVNSNSDYTEYKDTILLPIAVFQKLASTPLATGADGTGPYNGTILDWILKYNIYTATTGSALTIKAVRGLETAGTGGVGRAVAYRNAPDVARLMMPMPFRFLPGMQVGPLKFDVPGIMRLSGVDVRLPFAMEYMDGVNTAAEAAA